MGGNRIALPNKGDGQPPSWEMQSDVCYALPSFFYRTLFNYSVLASLTRVIPVTRQRGLTWVCAVTDYKLLLWTIVIYLESIEFSQTRQTKLIRITQNSLNVPYSVEAVNKH